MKSAQLLPYNLPNSLKEQADQVKKSESVNFLFLGDKLTELDIELLAAAKILGYYQ